MSERRRKLVVAGLVSDGGTRVLITQRPPETSHPLEWEFPGGKIEPGEHPETALKRELLEEIGIRVHVDGIWDVMHHDYRAFEVIMLVYACRLLPDQIPKCLEVHDLAWCSAHTLDDYPLLPADRPLIERLQREGIPNRPRTVAAPSEC